MKILKGSQARQFFHKALKELNQHMTKKFSLRKIGGYWKEDGVYVAFDNSLGDLSMDEFTKEKEATRAREWSQEQTETREWRDWQKEQAEEQLDLERTKLQQESDIWGLNRARQEAQGFRNRLNAMGQCFIEPTDWGEKARQFEKLRNQAIAFYEKSPDANKFQLEQERIKPNPFEE